jgi:hypothetical protein
MRRLVKRAIRRILSAGGYAIVDAATLNQLQQTQAETKSTLNQLQQTQAETKAGVSALQSQASALQSHLGELLRLVGEIQELQRESLRVHANIENTLRPQNIRIRELPYQLDFAATRCRRIAETEDPNDERNGLAVHYARSANLASAHWMRQGKFLHDPYPDDDLTLDYTFRKNIYVVGPGNEVEINAYEPVPWRHLFTDPDCGVFLILGQSNAANHSNSSYSPQQEVYSLDFLRMTCSRACDPLPGASGTGGSVWSRLGDLLVKRKVYRRVLFVPLAFGGSFIVDWLPGGSKHSRVALALSRLAKEVCLPLLPFSAVLWQQGEAEANHTQMSPLTYQEHFRCLVAELRSNRVFAPVFVARTTICEAGAHLYQNHAAIREAQLTLPDAAKGIFPGPDIDMVGIEERFDGCHFSDRGAHHCAELWLEVLSVRRCLLEKCLTD